MAAEAASASSASGGVAERSSGRRGDRDASTPACVVASTLRGDRGEELPRRGLVDSTSYVERPARGALGQMRCSVGAL